MIVGAYPSARLEKRRSIKSNRYRFIPVADNLQPFGYEEYSMGLKSEDSSLQMEYQNTY